MLNKKLIYLAGLLLLVALAIFLFNRYFKEQVTPNLSITNFQECVEAGYPILESYPQQCRTQDGRIFVEYIGNELEKMDLIRINNPRPNQIISSPLLIEGEARGFWFFEADFPVKLLDDQGNEIVVSFATAQGEWMIEGFVGFSAEIEFSKPATKTGTLILEKDNPSGLPENADQLIVPVNFE
jgi:hypothetical protein